MEIILRQSGPCGDFVVGTELRFGTVLFLFLSYSHYTNVHCKHSQILLPPERERTQTNKCRLNVMAGVPGTKQRETEPRCSGIPWSNVLPDEWESQLPA